MVHLLESFQTVSNEAIAQHHLIFHPTPQLVPYLTYVRLLGNHDKLGKLLAHFVVELDDLCSLHE